MKLHLLILSFHQPESASLGVNCGLLAPLKNHYFHGGRKTITLWDIMDCQGTQQEGKREATVPTFLSKLMSSIPFSYKNMHQLVCLRLKCLHMISSHTF